MNIGTMGMFEKDTANIQDCVRLNYAVPDLRAPHYLKQLPVETANAHKIWSVRKKWDLHKHGKRYDAVLDMWPELDQFITNFPGDGVLKAHISLLPAKTHIKIHTDGFGFKDNYRPLFSMFNETLRIHVPLKTSAKSHIYCGGQFYHMRRNECWMMNNFRPHSAINDHETEGRYHLIMDIIPNQETMKLLEAGDGCQGVYRHRLMTKLREGEPELNARQPDFFVLGAMKSGTTSLYRYLMQHPDIAPAKRKELHYYDHKRYGEWSFQEYLRQFPEKKRHQMSFEGTVYYLRHPHAPKWIKEDFPTGKFIALLRNPIDRAYSHYNQKYIKDKEHRSFEDAVKGEVEFIREDWEKACLDETHIGRIAQSHSYLARGRYAEQLKHWFQYFPKNRFHILFTEELAHDPQLEMQKIFNFLGVPTFPGLKTDFREKERQYASMEPNVRAWLSDYFEPHNRELEELLGRTLPW